ncbi:MAG: transcriptional repressor [Eubacteriales bacterium]|nr:transcriptional repressor [Eubacteriales bacterium]
MPEKMDQAQETIYHRSRMQREMIIQTLRERGCRITKQRLLLLDIILDNEYACCKEIYYKASQKDPRIGTATVYRMVKTLEDIGAIVRNNMYQIKGEGQEDGVSCIIELSDHTVLTLPPEQWSQVVKKGLGACGYGENRDVLGVRFSHDVIRKRR